MIFINFLQKRKYLLIVFLAIFYIINFQILKADNASACGMTCSSFSPSADLNCMYNQDILAGADDKACVISPYGTIGSYGNADCQDTSNLNACTVNKCPDYFLGLADGATCQILDSTGIVSCTLSTLATGKWDADDGRCISCNGKLQNTSYTIGSTSPYNIISTALTALCDAACDATVSASCDERAVGYTSGGYICNSSCQWVAVATPTPPLNALTLDVSWSVNPVTVSSTSTATFTVKKASDSSAVSGATVTVTSVSCGTLPSPVSVTDGSGQTTATFTAPATGSTCTINTKATLGGYTDGTLTTSISVSICGGSNFSQYDKYRYVKGESLRLDGLNPDGSGNWYLCFYNGSNSKMDENQYSADFTPNIEYYTATTTGIWKGLAVAGTGGCPGTYDANQGCASSTDVVECDSGKVGNCASGVCNLSSYTCASATPTSTPTATPGNFRSYKDAGTWRALNCASPMGSDCSTLASCTEAPPNPACYAASDCDDASGGNVANCCNNVASCATEQLACNCSVTGTPTGTPGTPTGTAVPGTTCGIDVPPSCKLGCLPQDPDCAAPGCTVTSSGVTICNPTLTNSFDLLVQNVTGWILGIIGSLALLFLIIGGIMYIGAGGDQDRIKTAKTIVTAVVIGLIVVIASYSIINEIKKILGY